MRIILHSNGNRSQVSLNHWCPTGDRLEEIGCQTFEALLPESDLIVRLFLKSEQGLWKVRLEHQGKQPIRIERVELLKDATILHEVASSENDRADYAFFENGWQSWSYSAAYTARQKARRTNLEWIYPGIWSASGTPIPRQTGRFASDFFGVLFDRQNQQGWVTGFLSQREQFGTVAADLRGIPILNLWANCDGVVLAPGGSLETDWAVLLEISTQADDCFADPLHEYVRLVAQENQARVPARVPAGWCSWYHYYQNVSEEDVRRNLQATLNNNQRWPLDLIQIDDGYEILVGEWDQFNERFPQGVADLASKIKDANMLAGIWLAPFIFQPQAETARSHPDWMIQDRSGRPRFAGFNWNSRTQALDTTHPEAQEWLHETIRRTVVDWGFPYLKLDFLYAGGLPGRRHDPTRTNAQALYAGLEIIRKAAGEETFLLGCGCPLGPGVGIFDAMRISADTAPAWGNHYFGMAIPFLAEPHAPSAENALHNVLTRANLHQKWWWNDPDCILLRPESQLSLAEVQTIASVIALTGGMLLVSDDLNALPVDRQEMLSQMLPPIQSAGVVLDTLAKTEPTAVFWQGEDGVGPFALVALINWEKKVRSLTFDPKRFKRYGPLWLSSFWDDQVVDLASDQKQTFENVPAHGTVLLAVRKKLMNTPVQYLGGTLHISQGVELQGMSFDELGFTLSLELPRLWQGEVRLRVAQTPTGFEATGATIQSWQTVNQILRLKVSGENQAKIIGYW